MMYIVHISRRGQAHNVSYACLLHLLLPSGIFAAGIEVEANLLYFSTISNIQYYNETSGNINVVFDNLGYSEELECNLCDHKIYWIELSGSMINRGNPNDPMSVETVSP